MAQSSSSLSPETASIVFSTTLPVTFTPVLTSLLLGVVGGMLGPSPMVGVLAFAVTLMLSTGFYVSLWFSFVDCFGSPDEGDAAPATADAAS